MRISQLTTHDVYCFCLPSQPLVILKDAILQNVFSITDFLLRIIAYFVQKLDSGSLTIFDYYWRTN